MENLELAFFPFSLSLASGRIPIKMGWLGGRERDHVNYRGKSRRDLFVRLNPAEGPTKAAPTSPPHWLPTYGDSTGHLQERHTAGCRSAGALCSFTSLKGSQASDLIPTKAQAVRPRVLNLGFGGALGTHSLF